MRHLFVAQDDWEAASAVRQARRLGLDDTCVLGISTDAPFAVDLTLPASEVARWGDYGVHVLERNHYALGHYAHIARVVEACVAQWPQRQRDAMQNEMFLFPVITELGWTTFWIIDTLATFFATQRPQVVFTNVNQGFIGELIASLARHIGAALREISG